MKRLVAAAAILILAACSTSTAPTRHLTPSVNRDQAGDPCTDMFGRSGYLVTAGDKLVCQ